MAEPAGFDPEEILRVLEAHGVVYVLIGGLAATLHGSPHLTTDVDVTPAKARDNLVRLAAALDDLDARIRVEGEPAGLAFDRSAEMLERVTILNLITRAGALDLCMTPAGTGGYDDLRRGAEALSIKGIQVPLASLADVIRSKEASGREKDRLTLPTLRELQERMDAGR